MNAHCVLWIRLVQLALMKAEITTRTDTSVTFTITVEAAELKHAADHAYDALRPRVKVSGFRPGKAPNNIVERELGANAVQSEALEHAVGHSYSDAVTKEKLTVISQPNVEIKKFVPYTELEYEATVEIMPPVTLADYKKIKKAQKAAVIETKQVDDVLDDLRRRVATRIPVERSAEMGDEVKIDFEGKKGGEIVPGAVSKNYTLKLGSQSFIPGFEEELIGMKPGDQKIFTVTFPKNYHEKNLAGEPVEFTVVLHDLIELKLPEVNDSFASEVGPFKTIVDLRTDISQQLQIEADEAASRDYENELLEEIIKKSKIPIPEILLGQQMQRLKVELSQRLAGSGLDMEKYLQAQGKTPEEMDAELRPEAERRVQLAMVLSEVAKQEGLAVDPQEIDDEIAELRKRYSDAAMQKELAGDRIREDVYNHLMAGRTIKKLIEYAQA